MSDRERLEKIVREAREEWASDDLDDSVSSRIVKHLLAAGVSLPPAPPPVLEVTEEADKAFCGGYDKAAGFSVGWNGREPYIGNRAAGYRAAFPHLLRSCADGLTDEECEAICGGGWLQPVLPAAAEIGMTDGSGLIRTILRRVAARREA